MQTGTKIQELFPTFVLGLEESEVDVLAGLVHPRHVPEGTDVLTHGEHAADLVVVLDGRFRVTVPPDVVLGDKTRREWTGDLGFVCPGPAMATVTAVEDGDLLVLPQEALENLAAHPRIVGRLWTALARNLASRLRSCMSTCACEREKKPEILHRALATLHGMPPVHEPISWVPSMMPAPVPGNVDELSSRKRLVKMLEDVQVFGPLDRKFLTLLARAAVFAAYEEGDTIMSEGDERDRLFLILDGRVTVSMPKRLAECGAERQLHAGEMLGQLSFVDGGPRAATCRAAVPTTVAAWYPAMIEEFLRLGADGGVAAVHFLHWVTRQIARDAERIGAFLKEAHAWSA